MVNEKKRRKISFKVHIHLFIKWIIFLEVILIYALILSLFSTSRSFKGILPYIHSKQTKGKIENIRSNAGGLVRIYFHFKDEQGNRHNSFCYMQRMLFKKKNLKKNDIITVEYYPYKPQVSVIKGGSYAKDKNYGPIATGILFGIILMFIIGIIFKQQKIRILKNGFKVKAKVKNKEAIITKLNEKMEDPENEKKNKNLKISVEYLYVTKDNEEVTALIEDVKLSNAEDVIDSDLSVIYDPKQPKKHELLGVPNYGIEKRFRFTFGEEGEVKLRQWTKSNFSGIKPSTGDMLNFSLFLVLLVVYVVTLALKIFY